MPALPLTTSAILGRDVTFPRLSLLICRWDGDSGFCCYWALTVSAPCQGSQPTHCQVGTNSVLGPAAGAGDAPAPHSRSLHPKGDQQQTGQNTTRQMVLSSTEENSRGRMGDCVLPGRPGGLRGGGGIRARPAGDEGGAVWRSGEASLGKSGWQVQRPWGGSRPGVMKAQRGGGRRGGLRGSGKRRQPRAPGCTALRISAGRVLSPRLETGGHANATVSGATGLKANSGLDQGPQGPAASHRSCSCHFSSWAGRHKLQPRWGGQKMCSRKGGPEDTAPAGPPLPLGLRAPRGPGQAGLLQALAAQGPTCPLSWSPPRCAQTSPPGALIPLHG